MQSTVLQKMALYFGQDVRRINHALKVYGFTQILLEGEKVSGETRLITELAAILHDIGIKEAERKYQSSAGHFQEAEGPAVAIKILQECGINGLVADKVCFLVGHHHSYSKIDGIDFQILVEGDFLVNIFEGYIPAEAAPATVKKYFRTQTGIDLAKSMYNL